MDLGTTLKHLAPFAIPILALFIPIVAMILSHLGRVRRMEALHETIRQFSQNGQPIPPQWLQAVAADPAPGRAGWTPAALLRAGMVNVALGLGLVVLFLAMLPGEWLWAIGAIPLFIGLALLAAWRLEGQGRAADALAPAPRT